jgi:polyisoprenoid-binding protein YceI
MRIRLPGLSLIVALAPAISIAAPLTVDLPKSEVAFVSTQMGVPVDGKFRKFAAQVDFDAKKPEAAKVKLDVDIASIDAGSAEANGEVVGKNWLAAARFPQATFVSSAVKSTGPNRYEVTGQMTIKGKTLPLTAPFTVRTQGTSQVFEGTFVMKRGDFAIGEGPWADPETVANEIKVKFRLVANPAK